VTDDDEQGPLDKARAAMAHARELSEQRHGLDDQFVEDRMAEAQLRDQEADLLSIASLQIQLAQAEALTRLADMLDLVTDPRPQRRGWLHVSSVRPRSLAP
jgi:hypothetical protein